MTAPIRIAAFIAMLAVVFAAALWVGATFGPNPDIAVPHPATAEHHDPDGGHPQ